MNAVTISLLQKLQERLKLADTGRDAGLVGLTDAILPVLREWQSAGYPDAVDDYAYERERVEERAAEIRKHISEGDVVKCRWYVEVEGSPEDAARQVACSLPRGEHVRGAVKIRVWPRSWSAGARRKS